MLKSAGLRWGEALHDPVMGNMVSTKGCLHSIFFLLAALQLIQGKDGGLEWYSGAPGEPHSLGGKQPDVNAATQPKVGHRLCRDELYDNLLWMFSRS